MLLLIPSAVARMFTEPALAPAESRPVEESIDASAAPVRLTIDHVTVGLEAVSGRTVALICRVAFAATDVAPPAADTVTEETLVTTVAVLEEK